MMVGRDAFLTLAGRKHYEFSSLRRTKFSAMALLYELRNQRQDRLVYTCIDCKKHIETRYHCTVCDDFDLCVNCYTKDGHKHEMQKLGFGLDDDAGTGNPKEIYPEESRLLSIQRCIQYLEHACHCRDANCRLPSCRKMKRIVQHSKSCKKPIGGCPICKQLIALCWYHAKHCREAKCPVPFCFTIKYKFKQQQQQQKKLQEQILKSRKAAMQNRGMSSFAPQTSPGNSNSSSQPSLGATPHCTVCNDFVLCVNCYTKDGHKHEMQKLGFGLDDDAGTDNPKEINPEESRLLSVQRCIRYLEHACHCRDANCRLPSCQKMKRIVQHSKSCKKLPGGCPICKQLIALCCYHAKHCQEAICLVPFCVTIKHKFKQQEQQRMLQEQILNSNSSSQPSPGATPHPPQPDIGMKPELNKTGTFTLF